MVILKELGVVLLSGVISVGFSYQLRHVGHSLPPHRTIAPTIEPRGLILSSVGVSSLPCRTISGVVSPTPSSAICGVGGSSKALTGAGTIVGYTAGSPYVASLAACGAQCLANPDCTNLYFIQGSNCNLHFGGDAFNSGIGTPLFQFYDRSCFECQVTTTAFTSTTVGCKTISGVVSPTPSGTICGVGGSSLSLAGAGSLISYNTGSIYVSSLSACSAQCLATTGCTNIYFIQGSHCNLHYGPDAFNKGVGNPLFQFYDVGCFTCQAPSTVTTTTTPTPCSTVSGVISPTPSNAICGIGGSSLAKTGAGTIIGYVAGSPHVANLAACSAICLATATCTNIYFIQGSNCNLHFGPDAFNKGVGTPLFQFYDVSCFTCPVTSTASHSATPSTTSTSTTIIETCKTVFGLASPTPTGAICGGKGSSTALTGAGTLVGYGSGSPYVASLAACSAKCLATSCCTNIYFISGSYCNLHYGPSAFLPNAGSTLFDFYNASCFTCESLSCASTTTDSMAVTTTFTPPAQCTQGHLTQLAYSGDGIWVNAIIPVPTSTITSCYPSQFANSVIAEAVSSTVLPPFRQLVCPYNWETFYYNSTYIVCCPTYVLQFPSSLASLN